MVTLLSFLPRISLQVLPSAREEAKIAKKIRVQNEIRSIAMELCVGEDWRELVSMFGKK